PKSARRRLSRANTGRLRRAVGRPAGWRSFWSVLAHRGRRAAFERGDAGGAQRLGAHESHASLTALADLLDALALDVLEVGLLLRSVDVPKAEIVVVGGGHFQGFPSLGFDRGAIRGRRALNMVSRRLFK